MAELLGLEEYLPYAKLAGLLIAIALVVIAMVGLGLHRQNELRAIFCGAAVGDWLSAGARTRRDRPGDQRRRQESFFGPG